MITLSMYLRILYMYMTMMEYLLPYMCTNEKTKYHAFILISFLIANSVFVFFHDIFREMNHVYNMINPWVK